MQEETKEVKEEKKDIMQDVKKKTEEIMKTYIDKELNTDDLEILGGLVDIHKDISNEEYWKRKEIFMRYNYGNYSGNYNGRGPSGGGYGEYGDNYSEYENYMDGYGARKRDSRGRYRGDDELERMGEHYSRYEEGRQYGAKEDSMRSLKYMLESMENFARMLKEEATSQEEVQMIRQTAQKIAQM